MNFKRITILFVPFFATVLFTGCKTQLSVEQPSLKPVPDSYGLGADSSNVADINWREFFGDHNVERLIDEALASNVDALIAWQRIERSRAQVLYNKGLLLPVLTGEGAASVNRYGLYTMDGSGNVTTEILPGQIVPANLPDYYLGLQASWEADISGKLRNKKKAAAARYLATVEGRKWLVTNLVAEIASAYYELLALDQQLAITESTISLQENALSIVLIQKQVGAANELAVKQFRSQVQRTRSLKLELEQRVVEVESTIAVLSGNFPQPVQRDSTFFNKPMPELFATGVPGDLLRNRPDIRASEMEVVASKADLKAAQAAFYPSLTINGDVGFQAFKTGLLFNNPESFVFGLFGGLSAPLVNRSAIKAQFHAASAYQIEALYNYQRNILDAYREVYTAIRNSNSLARLTEQKSNEVALLSEALQVALELYRTGKADYLEVLLTQQSALNARFELIDVRKRRLQAAVALYRSLGGGWQ